MADAIPVFEPGDQVTAVAHGAITGGRFVKLDGTPRSGGRPVVAPAGADPGVPHYVAAYSAADGEDVLVYFAGVVVPVVAGGTINAGDPVRSDTNGKAVVAASGEFAAGTAWDDAAAAAECPVKLQPYLVP